MTTSVSSPSKILPNFSCSRSTLFAWNAGLPTSKERELYGRENLSSTPCVCGPDRIIVGEVRGEEALDMLQAMNTGHDGSLTTIHANSPRDAIARLETMALMSNLNLPEKALRQQIASAVRWLCRLPVSATVPGA